MAEKKAWVTLVTENSYLKGLQSEDLESIKNEGCELKAIERIHPTNKLKEYIWDHYQDCWTKLRVWDIEGYDRVVFLDADILVMKNIDHLMNMNLPKDFLGAVNACTCNSRKKQNYPKDCGLLVLTPSKQIFEDLSNFLYNHPDVDSLCFPDQDVLNKYFKGKWVPLPYIYNAIRVLRTCHASTWEDKAVRNVHYVMSGKPWKKEIVDFEQEYDDIKKTGDQEAIFLFILNSWWWKVYKGIEFRIGDDY
ncbi:uncharacterized protein OCT59_008252 [Rhizophagus irregularis]|uniref:Glycogenin glucosyltransferase GLG2 n=2 Tax=Rhizophagus irregularis TaxID=588596 RepID=A0A015IPM3_RHIIW|nr:glycosyltransferase family 8 protein [Rhizophagus irregularis DAOM 181602=DAOM 197198]EXX59162.1 glycogenin glucosyltransferase GLG2 [Rhizophagus irregularis DAOM 197198w]POG62688.1 glycosyltransferase family 8 protein [Rhizophagus irregularis DAOM 181602=DAOM 197198]UZO16886.1 hypothetical protein OCT59_008252 [Rhizophagus irregularis]GBC42619.2 glycosyltransferase family 8 protein [Rhizophagus irregularis DAOM 181602=DAOM 197198]|eukprot:XP_025169554.1 glycosyltransferase family 8 protein [Rhizophagus irregularis DAOM 181602=DAOM 197198]